jgi:hypothetical protein
MERRGASSAAATVRRKQAVTQSARRDRSVSRKGAVCLRHRCSTSLTVNDCAESRERRHRCLRSPPDGSRSLDVVQLDRGSPMPVRTPQEPMTASRTARSRTLPLGAHGRLCSYAVPNCPDIRSTRHADAGHATRDADLYRRPISVFSGSNGEPDPWSSTARNSSWSEVGGEPLSFCAVNADEGIVEVLPDVRSHALDQFASVIDLGRVWASELCEFALSVHHVQQRVPLERDRGAERKLPHCWRERSPRGRTNPVWVRRQLGHSCGIPHDRRHRRVLGISLELR